MSDHSVLSVDVKDEIDQEGAFLEARATLIADLKAKGIDPTDSVEMEIPESIERSGRFTSSGYKCRWLSVFDINRGRERIRIDCMFKAPRTQ